ncbi:MAG: hypothetical protein SH850_28705 [Planctomycetaceae bacterium]|nr:hypothetical protein [Planctomycetaceae bacterium]
MGTSTDDNSHRVVVVHLRQPNRRDPNERRSDPFWEFGSFGCTRCHIKNLMNPKRIDELAGVRLAFAQGGPEGHRLVHLTPPVKVVRHKDRCELCWATIEKPFKYEFAPILAGRDGTNAFPLLRKMLSRVDRTTLPAKFSSCFRSRRRPLRKELSLEIIRVFDTAMSNATSTMIATRYEDALPVAPNKIDKARRKTYQSLLAEAAGKPSSKHECTSDAVGPKAGFVTAKSRRC